MSSVSTLPPQAGSCNCRRRKLRRRDIVAGATSLGVWFLVPKCPICLAAYVTLWTGLGLSFTQAAYLRWFLLCVSFALLIYLSIKHAFKTGTDHE